MEAPCYDYRYIRVREGLIGLTIYEWVVPGSWVYDVRDFLRPLGRYYGRGRFPRRWYSVHRAYGPTALPAYPRLRFLGIEELYVFVEVSRDLSREELIEFFSGIGELCREEVMQGFRIIYFTDKILAEHPHECAAPPIPIEEPPKPNGEVRTSLRAVIDRLRKEFMAPMAPKAVILLTTLCFSEEEIKEFNELLIQQAIRGVWVLPKAACRDKVKYARDYALVVNLS